MRYNNYHKHTYYSNLRTLDCIVSPEEYMQRAVELGHTTYFTTEHGFQGNLFEAQTLCEKYKLKLIYGVEAYYVDDICDKTDRRSFHLILIGLTEKARYEINRILSIANTDGFYYKPRIGLKELLSLTPTETIVTTACVAGRMFKPKSITTTEEIVGWEEVEELIDDHDPDAGTRKRNKPIYKTEIEGPDSWYTDFFVPVKNHFKDNFYLEVQAHNEPSQIEYNKKILEVARRTNTKIIHACDSHYIYPQDSRKRDLFLSAKGMRYEEENNFILDYPSYDEIVKRYRIQGVLTEEEAIQAINNTLIFDNAEPVYTDKEFKIPLVPNQFIQEELGPGYTNDNNDKVLREIIGRAFQKELRAGKIKPENKEKYMKAIVDEVETVRQCGMASYFVLDHIVVQRAVQKYGAVLTRSGRGSAVSFVINKFLGLTEVDRIKAPVTLYPSRFMSAERILSSRSLPDIDLNFADVKPVIQASKDVLGEDGIYYMIAYKPLQRSSAFRLYCKAIGQPIEAYDEVAKFLAVKGNTDEMFCEEYPSWANVLEASKIFRGVIESVAPSPCSFLLSNDHISEKIGLIKVGNEICCTLDGYNCDVYKFLKNDYLTVSVYSLINETYKLIGRPIDDISTLVNNCDKKVWDIYANGLTTTINQTDSDMGKQLIMKYKPTNLAELSAWVAAIRPGFASLLKYFLDRTGYSTGVPELDNILTDSYHYMMYQENIMSFLVWLGIEEKGTYDIIKKISKKKFTEEELTNLKNVLRENWMKKVGSVDFFEENWRTVQDAAHYSFNACVSGDTKIQRAGYNNRVFVPTVEEMYRIKNDVEYAKATGHMSLHQKYCSTGYGNALSMCDDNRIRKNAIVDIRYSGIREIYRVTTASGATLDCTMNHKFPTINGKKRLDELNVGDYLFVKGQYEINTSRYPFTNGVFENNVPKKGQIGFQKNPDGNSVRFHQKENLCRSEQRACEICGKKYDGSRFELHHMDLDRTNNSDENLCWLCNSCHKKEHYRQNRKKMFEKGIPTFLDQIVSIEYLRTDKTYDIEMAAPYHTFVSENGLVTSNSHALSVAIDSLYGAYLKAHYPLEYFTVALSLYSDDMTRTANLTKELSYFNITLQQARFGKSGAYYTMDKEAQTIYKGVASIKFCNAQIADELMALSKNHYSTFIDLLDDISEKTSVNSKQLNILIGLNFFEQFGANKYLQMVTKLYDDFHAIKQIKKSNLEHLYHCWHITEDMVREVSEKETEKIFKGINTKALMNFVLPEIPNQPLSVVDQIKFEIDNLEMILYVNHEVDPTLYVVTEYRTFQDHNKPYLTLYRLNDGNYVKTKIKRGDLLPVNPFRLYSILQIPEFKMEYKMKKDADGNWQRTDELALIMEKYDVIRV